jgi:hypothetical protein
MERESGSGSVSQGEQPGRVYLEGYSRQEMYKIKVVYAKDVAQIFNSK